MDGRDKRGQDAGRKMDRACAGMSGFGDETKINAD
jgi:hypothetical protein